MKSIILKTSIIFSFFLNIHGLSAQSVVEASFTVEGNCGQCKERIEDACMRVSGVKICEWNKKTGELKVTYKSNKVELETIHAAVAQVGHDTEQKSCNEESYNKLPDCCKYKDGKTGKH